MAMEDEGHSDEASKLFLQAWNEAANDFEKFTAAYYVARHQANAAAKLQWLDTALQFALKINDESVNAAFPSLYSKIAECYEELNDLGNARKNLNLRLRSRTIPLTLAPFITEHEQTCASAICCRRAAVLIIGRSGDEPYLFHGDR